LHLENPYLLANHENQLNRFRRLCPLRQYRQYLRESQLNQFVLFDRLRRYRPYYQCRRSHHHIHEDLVHQLHQLYLVRQYHPATHENPENRLRLFGRLYLHHRFHLEYRGRLHILEDLLYQLFQYRRYHF
jgi:hypothetical protein